MTTPLLKNALLLLLVLAYGQGLLERQEHYLLKVPLYKAYRAWNIKDDVDFCVHLTGLAAADFTGSPQREAACSQRIWREFEARWAPVHTGIYLVGGFLAARACFEACSSGKTYDDRAMRASLARWIEEARLGPTPRGRRRIATRQHTPRYIYSGHYLTPRRASPK